MSSKCPLYGWLIAIVVIYTGIGALYAIFTPTWQVPDEPAHYNYVRALAEGEGFPVIERGDYDQDLLDELTSRDFPPEISIDPLRYEDHQPPLYYLLLTPIYWLFNGAVLPLRLFSVLLGAGVLVVAFGTVRAIFPARPSLAAITAAFIAFIPQHVAMMAGVENDGLAELVVGGMLWALVTYVNRRHNRPWLMGALLAAALLTKTTAYMLVGLAIIAVVIRWRQEQRTWRWAVGQIVWIVGPAILISAPWFIRNGVTYGWLDLTGVGRHNEIVEGQPRSMEWLADYGWRGLLSRLVSTTFHSFWGQFGWMKVVLPNRIYQFLMLLSALLCVGFLWWVFDRRRSSLTSVQRANLALLLSWTVFTVGAFLGYNLIFVQHQGRYLFPALIPIGLATALGIDQLTQLVPYKMRQWVIVAFFAGMASFDVYSVFRFIIPHL